MADLRILHNRVLCRKPIVADLPENLRYVANASRGEEDDSVWRWFGDQLSSEDWDRIHEAQAEELRRQAEQKETIAFCQRGDEPGLRAMYPGHAAYYDMVVSLPIREERPMDAVVVIEIGASLASKAKSFLESGMAQEALQVQYGRSPNKYANRFSTERFFMGYFTPEIEARMNEPRPDCKLLRNNQYTQAACRRDTTVLTVRDWLKARGHKSVRFLITQQASWPHFDLLFGQFLSDYDTCIDTKFHKRLPRNTSFLREMCVRQRGPGVWIDYEAYVSTLDRDRRRSAAD